MIQDKESGDESHRIVVTPNLSLSNRGAVVFFLVVSAPALAIAFSWAARGMWPILPFAGAELLLLGLCLYLVQRRQRFREVITLEADQVVLQRGMGRPQETHRFNRAWVRVELDEATHLNYPVRLFLREGNREQEVGRCLPEDERRSLGKRLKGLLAKQD